MKTVVISPQNTLQLAAAVQELESKVYIPWRYKNTLRVCTIVQNNLNEDILPQWLQDYEITTNADVVLTVLEPHTISKMDLVQLIEPLLQNDYFFTYKPDIGGYGYILHRNSVLHEKDLLHPYKHYFEPKHEEINSQGLFNKHTTKIFL